MGAGGGGEGWGGAEGGGVCVVGEGRFGSGQTVRGDWSRQDTVLVPGGGG